MAGRGSIWTTTTDDANSGVSSGRICVTRGKKEEGENPPFVALSFQQQKREEKKRFPAAGGNELEKAPSIGRSHNGAIGLAPSRIQFSQENDRLSPLSEKFKRRRFLLCTVGAGIIVNGHN